MNENNTLSLNELWQKVTGLVGWNIEEMTEEEKKNLVWYIPDGAVLGGENDHAMYTKQLLDELGINKEERFSEGEFYYDNESNKEETGS